MRLKKLGCTVAGCFAFGMAATAFAASHSDAPLIKQDPQANITDVYTFVGRKYDDAEQRVLNVIVHVRPFSEPGDGVMYDRFADDARYSIHVAHPTTGATLVRYDFQFSRVNPITGPGLKNPNTALSYGVGTEVGPILTTGDARQNFTQTYRVTRVEGAAASVIGSNLPVPPPNVGRRTTPAYNDDNGNAVSGATTLAELDAYTSETLRSLPSGEAVWAGPREDGFYSDIPGIFDLLDGRILDNNGTLADGFGQDGNGVDGFKGFNVLAFAVQIPLSLLTPHMADYPAAFADLEQPLPAVGTSRGVGVYASVSRQRTTVRTATGATNAGPFVQVNRMGNPLFNELLVPLSSKDRYNGSAPTGDASFATFASNPEVATLINVVFGTSFANSGRGDVALVYIPDVIRVDTTTPPVRLAGQDGFSRFGFAGGDTVTNAAGHVMSSGWPNGRRLGDDVVDIALTAVASGPSYAAVTVVGDNVDANDQLFNEVFPYSATPHAGPTNRKDPVALAE